MHKAIREAMVNMIIHADFQLDGTLKVIKKSDTFLFTNPGILKISKEMIYQGGNSKPRNPRMQTMFRMVGFGDSAGSGFPMILSTWKKKNWPVPDLEEDTILNQVTLRLSFRNKVTNKVTDRVTSEVTNKESQLLDYLSENPQYTMVQLAEKMDVSRKTVGKYIKKLKEQNILIRMGSNRNGYWKINRRH